MNEHDQNRKVVLHTRVMAGTGGGPEKTILRSHEYARDTRYEMSAAYLYPAGDPGIRELQAQYFDINANLIDIPEKRALDFQALKDMRNVCERSKVDIYHGHDYKSNLFGLLVKRKQPEIKLATTVHLWTEETLRLKFYRKVDEWCLPKFDRIIAVSKPLYDRCLEIGVAEDKLSLIHNAIEIDEWSRKHNVDEAQAALDLPLGVHIGFVGRLSVQKALDKMIKLFARLRERCQYIHLHLVGDGPERQMLEALTFKLDLEDYVHFHGWQTNRHQWYEAFDIVLMTSLREGLANTLLEAMALGVPAVSTDAGDAKYLFDDNRCGLLLNDDEDDWADQMLSLIDNEARRDELAEAGHERIKNDFNFDKRMQKIFTLYDELV